MGQSTLRDAVFAALTKGQGGIDRRRFRLTDHDDPVYGRVLRLFSTAAEGSSEEARLFRDVEECLRLKGFVKAMDWMPVEGSRRVRRHIQFTSAPSTR